tara:strand:- start:68 stop:307 length:240 start_codon:yes stop_codon:yes gene_type:complete
VTVKDLVLELVERIIRIENEMKLLRDDRKILFDDYKEKLDIKAVKAAMQIARIRSKLGDSEAEVDNILDAVESKITLGG